MPGEARESTVPMRPVPLRSALWRTLARDVLHDGVEFYSAGTELTAEMIGWLYIAGIETVWVETAEAKP